MQDCPHDYKSAAQRKITADHAQEIKTGLWLHVLGDQAIEGYNINVIDLTQRCALMAVQLSQPEFQRLVRILQNQPDFGSPYDRQQMITMAFGNAGKADIIRGRLNMSGAPMGAAVELVNFLCKFGQISPGVEALGVLLQHLLSNMGAGDEANFLNEIMDKHKLNNPPTSPAPVAPVPTPDPVAGASEKYVFISYARPDQPVADKVEDYLKAAGFRVFRDIRDIRTGDNWDLTIEKGLQQTSHMVLLLSSSSMPDRKEVHREWMYFDQKKKPIVPLYIEDCTLHSRMMIYNYIDARTDLAGALIKVVDRLKS